MRTSLLLFLAIAASIPAQQPDSTVVPAAIDPTYRLNRGDSIIVSIYGEPELGAQQIIDREGRVRLPLVGAVDLGGRSVREAEAFIEQTYRDRELLKQPQVTVAMGTYAPREISVLGAVRTPGTFQFPPNATRLDIRDVIARHGGFMPVAKADAVSVTRQQPDGSETTTVVDVDRMMSGRVRDNSDIFQVFPGDRIFVPERLF